jgi:hypothetical protein
MRRSWRTLALGAAAVVATGAAYAAGSGFAASEQYPVGDQANNELYQQTSTSSTTFVPVSGLDLLNVPSRGPATVTLSATVDGAPVDFAVKRDGRAISPPFAHFEPSSDPTSVSFTFIAGKFASPGCHAFSVRWRSPTGAAVTLDYANIVVDFHGAQVAEGCPGL